MLFRLLCRSEYSINPRELMSVDSPDGLFSLVAPYRAHRVEELAPRVTPSSSYGTDYAAWNEDIQVDERAASFIEPGRGISSATINPMQSPPSSIENYPFNPQEGISGDVLDTIAPSGLVSTEECLEDGDWEPQLNTCCSSFSTNTVTLVDTLEHEHISNDNRGLTTFDEHSQTAFEEVDRATVDLDDDALAGMDAIGSEYHAALLALSTKHCATLLQFIQCIGSRAAVLSLGLVVGNFRALHNNGIGKQNAMRIAATRSSAERLAAIDDLSACMAHFTLAQRMHIYMLYKEALAQGGLSSEAANDRDPFVLESGVSSVRSRGNPNHLQTAAISRNMTKAGQSPARAKTLRRVGRRLDMLVENFGRGVLALLDEKLTHDM